MRNSRVKRCSHLCVSWVLDEKKVEMRWSSSIKQPLSEKQVQTCSAVGLPPRWETRGRKLASVAQARLCCRSGCLQLDCVFGSNTFMRLSAARFLLIWLINTDVLLSCQRKLPTGCLGKKETSTPLASWKKLPQWGLCLECKIVQISLKTESLPISRPQLLRKCKGRSWLRKFTRLPV